MAKDIRVDIRFRRNHILSAIEKSYPSIASFAKAANLARGTIYCFLNFKTSPVTQSYRNIGKKNLKKALPGFYWKPSASKIASALGIPEIELFPEHLWAVRKNKYVKEIDSDCLLRDQVDQIEETQLLTYANKDLTEAVDNALETLLPQEAFVLRSRFGLDGNIETLEYIGESMSLSKQRIRQIEQKALRKMRHPARSRILRAALKK